MMTAKYSIIVTKHFERKYRKLTKANPQLKVRISQVFKILSKDPFYKGLKTHIVTTKSLGQKFSTRLTSDLRIIWEFSKTNDCIIIALDVGGHSGNRRVYM